MKIDSQQLVQAAADAGKNSVSPYSHFKVGAALLTKTGEFIGGANVESASYGLTCCAERIALFKALTDGKSDFVAVAVVARCDGGPMPCGRHAPRPATERRTRPVNSRTERPPAEPEPDGGAEVH